MHKIDQEDLAQECNAYLKIKYFMANRILELERDLESTNKQLSLQIVNNLQLCDLFKQIHIINMLGNKQENSLDISKESVESIVLQDINNENTYSISQNKSNYNNEDLIIPIKCNKCKTTDNIINDENVGINNHDLINKIKLDVSLNEVVNQNIELYKENARLKDEIRVLNFRCSKIATEKIIILNELNELLNSLNQISFKDLDKLHKEKLKQYPKFISDVNSWYIPSSLGIKYNILSTYSTISSIVQNVNKDISNKENETENITHPILESYSKNKNLFKSFQKEFEEIINSNLNKPNILSRTDDLD